MSNPPNPNPLDDEFTTASALIARLKGDVVVEVEVEETHLLLFFASGAIVRIPMDAGFDILIPLNSQPKGN